MSYTAFHRLLAFLLIGTTSVCYAYEDLGTSQLVDEAMLWQSKGRTDLAAESWRRILVTNPTHAQALLNLGLIAARAGKVDEAASFYSRAKKLPNPPTGLVKLATMIEKLQADLAPLPNPPQTETKVALSSRKPNNPTTSRDLPKEPKVAVPKQKELPPKPALPATAAPPPIQPTASQPPISPQGNSAPLLTAAIGLTHFPQQKK